MEKRAPVDTNFIIVVDELDDWRPYFPTDQVVSVQSYLFDPSFQENKGLRLINLCSKTGYLKRGYYCSMLAEARGHRVLPSLKTLNDLGKKQVYLHDLADFHEGHGGLRKDSANKRWRRGFFYHLLLQDPERKSLRLLDAKFLNTTHVLYCKSLLGHKNGRLKIHRVAPVSIAALAEERGRLLCEELGLL